MRTFRKKYSKNFHKIRKQKIMKSRKRSGGYPSLSIPNFLTKKKTVQQEFIGQGTTLEDTTIQDRTSEGSISEGSSSEGAILEGSSSEDAILDTKINTEEGNIVSNIKTEPQPNDESIEGQADKLFIADIADTLDNPENWDNQKITEEIEGKKCTITEINEIKEAGWSSYEELGKILEPLNFFLGDEISELKEKKKKYLEAINKYKEKRKEILILLNKQPNTMTALITSTKTLETIIEEALKNSKIPRTMFSDLVRAKVDMKKAKNIVDKSQYIIKTVKKKFYSLEKIYHNLREEEKARERAKIWFGPDDDTPRYSSSSSSSSSPRYEKNRNGDGTWFIRADEGYDMYDNKYKSKGGSKKRNTAKRHIKRRTKRHMPNNKRRHTKKRN